MPVPPTADDVARRFYECLNAKDIDGCAELWADDARIIVPYPPEGFPGEIVGKQTIMAGFHDLFGVYRRFAAELVDVWPGQDPNVATVHYRPAADLVDGSHYENDNVAIFETADGRIRTYHDYFDPRRFQVVVDVVERSQSPD